MNVVRMFNGLGNQMYQYAFARKLQIITGRTVYLDTRFINNEDNLLCNKKSDKKQRRREKYDLRSYKLDKLQIKLPTANSDILKHWQYLSRTGSLSKTIFEMAQKRLWPYLYYNEYTSVIPIGSVWPTYYLGNFINLKYYDDIKTILQKEFVLKEKLRLPPELKDILINENTVSVHIRRGDYIRINQDISHKAFYYPDALKLMEQKVGRPLIWLVFSDDIEWVKYNLFIEGKVVYVSDMGFQDYEELMIMKHCKHNIIANSTFSSWGAYLNANPDKIVIYPKIWRVNGMPDNWIGI